MEVEQFINSVFNSNTYILHRNGRGMIVDIGDFEPVKRFVEENGIEIEALFLTHTHYDHIYGIHDFMAAFPQTPVYTSACGKEALHRSNWNFSRYHDDEIIIESEMIRPLSDHLEVEIPEIGTVKAFATPGHDQSCLSYIVGDKLFSGDSYIPGVKVVASFPKSNRREAEEWYERLKEMARDFNLYPGHGEIFSIADKQLK